MSAIVAHSHTWNVDAKSFCMKSTKFHLNQRSHTWNVNAKSFCMKSTTFRSNQRSHPWNVHAESFTPMKSRKLADDYYSLQWRKRAEHEFCRRISANLLTYQELADCGYPVWTGDGQVHISPTQFSYISSKDYLDNIRICARCRNTYTVDSNGNQLEPEKCRYHSGKKSCRGDYSCCGGQMNQAPCRSAPKHIFMGPTHGLFTGFVESKKPSSSLNTVTEADNILALDCEMVYTTKGMELGRISLVNFEGNVVYDAVVRPSSPVVDYVTEFSGLTEQMMKNAVTTLQDVQTTLQKMITPNTILVGHSLHNDLRVLKFAHFKILDVGVVLQPLRSLRHLAEIYLQKRMIGNSFGHCCAEDAITSMELAKRIVEWKLGRSNANF